MCNRKLDGPEVLPGLICLVIGVFSSAVGLGLIPGKVNGPEWVMSIVGLLFFLAGFTLIRGKYLNSKSYIAGLMFMCFSLISLSLAFILNSGIESKLIFGLGSVISLVLFIQTMKGENDT